jgi:hypothetical protein
MPLQVQYLIKVSNQKLDDLLSTPKRSGTAL